MMVLGSKTRRAYSTDSLLGQAGEGAVYTLVGDPTRLLKIFNETPEFKVIEKLKLLSDWSDKPPYTALPVETVIDPTTKIVVGFVQPHFQNSLPLNCILDSTLRTSHGLSDVLLFRIRCCRLLAESFARIHAVHLVVGDVSDGNFLLGCDQQNNATVIYAIDCNSYQVTRRTTQGNELYPTGVATEEYTAPEVQSTDWKTSSRSVHSDSFGFAVLAWKILFNGSHPFAVISSGTDDIAPLGKRLEERLFPFSPATPLPFDWKPPRLDPPLSVLPIAVRESFFRTFSTADPRDRATAQQWCKAFQDWERQLVPGVVDRIMDRVQRWWATTRLKKARSWWQLRVWHIAVGAVIVGLAFVFPVWHSGPSPPAPTSTEPAQSSDTIRHPTMFRTNRTRTVDPELFPELFFPTHPNEE